MHKLCTCNIYAKDTGDLAQCHLSEYSSESNSLHFL